MITYLSRASAQVSILKFGSTLNVIFSLQSRENLTLIAIKKPRKHKKPTIHKKTIGQNFIRAYIAMKMAAKNMKWIMIEKIVSPIDSPAFILFSLFIDFQYSRGY